MPRINRPPVPHTIDGEDRSLGGSALYVDLIPSTCWGSAARTVHATQYEWQRIRRMVYERAGFTGQRLWRYMRADLPVRGLPHLAHVRVQPDPGEKDARRLEARQDDRLVAEAVVGLPVQGTGVLWWIGVEPSARGRGLGRAMLGSALDVLAGLGAAAAILYVDDDAPPGDERDRRAANALYDSAGFIEVDRLNSYTLSRPA
ncbi:GNAT family N-acetyltransferase [Streptomyces sp. NPDC002133]|uniref:GNAT family N-acetyltransferase n=1 Tax=Streptomyces sp. NPDC002133 TaxID=3154409 RepID=UPI00331F47FF